MRRLLVAAGLLFASLTVPVQASAAENLTYHFRHFLFTIAPSDAWRGTVTTWTYEGFPVVFPAGAFTASGSTTLPAGLERHESLSWDRAAIGAAIAEKISTQFDREARAVTIRSQSGAVVFEGVGMPGRKVDLEAAITLTIAALEQGVTRVSLPVTETPPTVTIDAELQARGIKEFVTIGESDYSRSPANRIHNITVGLNRFNGHIIPKGEVFSFVETLGPVNAATGYLKELVIKGDKTLPDYGGGLCQISSTAYRGAWEYGFPITQRKNHSFAVNHYAPQGTDATIYPPSVDMKFLNDSGGDLLMQTHKEDEKAYFIYYGTKDNRVSEVVGPYIWGYTAAPPERTEYTTDIPVGETRKVGEATPGMKAMWFRVLSGTGTGETIESVYSAYEARPRYFQVGVEALQPVLDDVGSLEIPPDWIAD